MCCALSFVVTSGDRRMTDPEPVQEIQAQSSANAPLRHGPVVMPDGFCCWFRQKGRKTFCILNWEVTTDPAYIAISYGADYRGAVSDVTAGHKRGWWSCMLKGSAKTVHAYFILGATIAVDKTVECRFTGF